MEWGGDFRVEENRFGESERGGERVLADRSRTTRQRRSQKFNEAETVSIYLFAARADSVAALRAQPGAEGRKRGAKIRCRPEASLELVALETEREIEIDRDREREISSRAYLYPPEFLARPSPLSLLSLGRRIVDDRG